jgi:hypothetical protein
MHDQHLETFMPQKGLFVLLQTQRQPLPFRLRTLVARTGGQQGQQGHQPEGKFLILHLQNQQLQQITLDYVVVSEDEFGTRVGRHVLTDEFYQVFDRLLAVGATDVGGKDALLLADVTHAAQTLNRKDYLRF